MKKKTPNQELRILCRNIREEVGHWENHHKESEI